MKKNEGKKPTFKLGPTIELDLYELFPTLERSEPSAPTKLVITGIDRKTKTVYLSDAPSA